MRKTITINGFDLSYLEKNERSNKIVFFIHGNSGSSRTWNNQLKSKLLKDYRLIAIDLPGHGNSFRSNNSQEDYSPLGTSKMLSVAVKELADNLPYAFVGFSYGTNLIAEILNHNINPACMVLAGCCVIGEDYGLEKIFTQQTSPSIFFYNESDNKAVASYLKESMSEANEEDIQNAVEDYLMVAADFKPMLFKTAGDGEISDEIIALNKLNIPICIIFGQKDNLVNIDYLDKSPFPVWRNHIYKLAKAGHFVHIDNVSEFNLLISEYLSEMFKVSHV